MHLKDLPEVETFYLTGGTAPAAFYLGHRKSNDLDFFTTMEELIIPFSRKIEEALTRKGFAVGRARGLRSFVEHRVDSPEEFAIIHLALDSAFRFKQPGEAKEFPRLKIDSLIDIATYKLLALFERATLRDFIDVYFLTREKFTKSYLVEKTKIKDPGLDLYWLGVAFELINEFSADSPEMLLLMKHCAVEELRRFFNEWRREIYQEITRS